MWPNKDKPGYPGEQEFHFLRKKREADLEVWRWNGRYWGYGSGPILTPKELLEMGYEYFGPCYMDMDQMKGGDNEQE